MSWRVQTPCRSFAEQMQLVDFGLRVGEHLIATGSLGHAAHYLQEVRSAMDHAEALARRKRKGGAS